MAVFEKLGNYSNFGLLMMRAGLGIMMVTHGYPKMMGGPEKWLKIGTAMHDLGIHDFPTFWGFMAAATEFLGGILVALGVFFRPACILMVFTMAVAATHHIRGGDGLGDASHAIELAFAFFGLIFLGPGKYSIDKN